MTDRVWIEDISKYEGKEVLLQGWLYNRRSSGKLHFLQVRDGTGIIQCVVFKGDVSPELFDLADRISQESAIEVRGRVKRDERSPLGYELGVTDLSLVHEALDYPITPKEHGVAFLMDHRHLWLRSSRQHAILRIRHEVIRAVRDFFDGKGFTLLDAPIFTPNACEGTTTLFSTEYFETQAYLTQSGQLYNEAGAMAFGKVYCFGPTFRAEKSKTRRHLTEFWMVEPEMAYCDLNQDMDLAEEFVEFVIQRVLENRLPELKIIERDIEPLKRAKRPFPRITYSEAIEILRRKGNNTPWGEDLGGDEETLISDEFDRPVMIHRYPVKCKAFYMKTDPGHPEAALCVDMLAPEGYGEIIGGGQREDDYETLKEKILHHGLSPEVFGWYLDLRRYGSVPHAGFGMGIERAVAWICGLKHVRETIPFPRMMERLTP
ncbi:MAG: asparagine--tRNA ligase [Nitrospirae bacterium CG_4_9_14_3_um_filter_53_35]|nr:MAG: asparagine--tRNA ligase [Nitrospirae bacterium CG2_30_53_67]PIS38328.1 MAG: asparagine--tRNA ligase [Nitrospirae bacterium CG08_land_8_20_14_0_20_52_24]PIV85488.1 MAG: asparagine--tRNA ligase [Nitrospirae bacterium CG17_big_fil_post_rev_8_21_14_2_50_50_9]PIW85209.1 MAG: asparagine--tRNA ligase [Nitrospirae bacterium CG_4_8_14_3_um_filter_50_41]PIX84521.1 MAG: asparagine--tRNA ligase [Nitrospirae bacterium CG_4_10_14_3_um_filter_53_41]PJA76762.1 MAG: asparagine--tRNA ligase [Nitrospirae